MKRSHPDSIEPIEVSRMFVFQRNSHLVNELVGLVSLVTSGIEECKNNEITQQALSEETLSHLSQITDVLRSIGYFEEGIEDAAALLCSKLEMNKEEVLKMLLDSAIRMAERMKTELETLLVELTSFFNATDPEGKNKRSKSVEGILPFRNTKEEYAPRRAETIRYVQSLSSMAPFISKTSSQNALLAILLVFVKLRQFFQSLESKNKDTNEENADEDDDDDGNDHDEERQGGSKADENIKETTPFCELLEMDHLWSTLSECLLQLENARDRYAVLTLKPALEAFFIVHASSAETSARPNENSPGPSQEASSQQPSQSSSGSSSSSPVFSNKLAVPPLLSPLPSDNDDADSSAQAQSTQHKFLKFAETHKLVLNRILREYPAPLEEGPFAVLVNHPRLIDYVVKERYVRFELLKSQKDYKEELVVHVRRDHLFEDSFNELYHKEPEEWKKPFYIEFEGEEEDPDGLLSEWFTIMSREIFNPKYSLFATCCADKLTYTISTTSYYNENHLCYLKFVGRFIAKAIFDDQAISCFFTRSFYKQILGIPVTYRDMEVEDYTLYESLVYLLQHHISSIEFEETFSTEVHELGATSVRDLLPNGQNIPVTEENKIDYVRLLCQMKITGVIRQQLDAFLEGFHDIIPNHLASFFNEQELEFLIAGLQWFNISDLEENTIYCKYDLESPQIEWFWDTVYGFCQAEIAMFLQFVTGTSKVPQQGFCALQGRNGIQKFQIHRDEGSTDRLPSAHKCYNKLNLPVYETYTKLRTYLLKAIHESSEDFGSA